MRRWVPLMLVSLVGCTPPSMLQCGPGTHQEGAFCVADDVTPPSPGDAGSDAGATLSDAGFSDAGPNDGGDGDAGPLDAGPSDAGLSDAGATDAGFIDSGALDSGPADAGLTDSGVVPPRLDGGALADGGFIAATDWSTTRGPALASRRVGTFAIGNGTILRVLPHGLILAEGSNCTGPGGPCTIRWVDDSGATLVSYASATQPQFVDDAQGSRAFLVANGTALTCSGMFVAYRLTGTALAVDTETGQPLHTLMNDAVAIEFSPGSQWVRARTRDAQMPCTFAGTAAWHDTRPPYAADSACCAPPTIQRHTQNPAGRK